MLVITPLVSAVLAVLFLVLTMSVILRRAQTNTSILTGDDHTLAERVRRQGNFTETVPLALILLAMTELNGAPQLVLYVTGGILLLGRVLHPFGLHHDKPAHPLRIVGMVCTQIAIGVSTFYIFYSTITY